MGEWKHKLGSSRPFALIEKQEITFNFDDDRESRKSKKKKLLKKKLSHNLNC